MARDHARIVPSIWQDQDWCALEAESQRVYLLVLSQPDLSWCGVIPYSPRRWAKKAADTKMESITEAIAILEDRQYIVVDEDEEELLVRTFIKHDGVLRNPNLTVAMTRDFGKIRSPLIRKRVLDVVAELFHPTDESRWEKLAEPFLYALAEHLVKELAKPLPEGLAKVVPKPVAEGLGNALVEGPGKGLTCADRRPPTGSPTAFAGSCPQIAVGQGEVTTVVIALADAELKAEKRRGVLIQNEAAWIRSKRDRLMAAHADDIAALMHEHPLASPAELVTLWPAWMRRAEVRASAAAFGAGRAGTEGCDEESVTEEALAKFGPEFVGAVLGAYRSAVSVLRDEA